MIGHSVNLLDGSIQIVSVAFVYIEHATRPSGHCMVTGSTLMVSKKLAPPLLPHEILPVIDVMFTGGIASTILPEQASPSWTVTCPSSETHVYFVPFQTR